MIEKQSKQCNIKSEGTFSQFHRVQESKDRVLLFQGVSESYFTRIAIMRWGLQGFIAVQREAVLLLIVRVASLWLDPWSLWANLDVVLITVVKVHVCRACHDKQILYIHHKISHDLTRKSINLLRLFYLSQIIPATNR